MSFMGDKYQDKNLDGLGIPCPGEVAYRAYCKFSNGKSLVTREQLPTWDQLSNIIREAWDAAAAAVLANAKERTP